MGSLPDTCGEILNERLMKYGYRNSCGALIKKRNVSITRVFPPGCGRNDPYMYVPPDVGKEETKAEKKPENIVTSDGGKASEFGNTSILHKLVGTPLRQELADSLSSMGKMVNKAEIKSEGAIKDKTMFGIPENWIPPQWSVDTSGILKERALKNRFPMRRISVIRLFPPFCGRNAPCPTEEDRLEIVRGRKNSQKSEMIELRERGSSSQDTGRKFVEEENGPAHDGYSKKRKLGVGTSPKLKIKFLKKGSVRGTADGSMEKNLITNGKALHTDRGVRVIKLKGTAGKSDKHSPALRALDEFQVIVPPFGPSSSGDGDMRNKVRETLRLFHAICRKLLQGEEAKLKLTGRISHRIDILSSNLIKDLGKEVNKDRQWIGSVPGVEVGDKYQYRVELTLVGVHRHYQSGIDYTKLGNTDTIIATSIVSSGGYADDLDSGEVLKYTGQGGNFFGRKKDSKEPEDQKLVRGNLALKNSISAKNPVRVIRGYKETKFVTNAKYKIVTSYTYDGLYNVERYWQEVGAHGKLVYMFELRRCIGQPDLAWKEVRNKGKIREGLCDDDISRGKEIIPVSAINTVDDEKPPKFNYITRMSYPDWCRPTPHRGCDCVGQCSNSQSCSCVAKNGELPYNYDGAIVETKSLVYECGPSCKCPPSCYNKVCQHGIKIQLEIFKTKSRGWGVRSLTSITSGTFICEYLGDLIEDKEAEQRENDEYLFDIGQNYHDCSVVSTLKTSAELSSDEVAENSGFTIDAAHSGNVGRFINHSCSPNLYAQNVLYDHEDKRMPHIMLFAADNISPFQELTYHYNYAINQYQDSTGNIKTKKCYCGSEVCTGRLY